MLTVNDAAELMLESEKYYTHEMIAIHFDVSEYRARTWLQHIVSNDIYKIKRWGRGVKLLAIRTRTMRLDNLQKLALSFERPRLLMMFKEI